MPKNILVTGASGLLGRSLMKALDRGLNAPHSPAEPYRVIGTAFSRLAPGLVRMDATDAAAVRSIMDEYEPALVVHSAAERRPDMVDRDPSAAERLNVGATELLAGLCAARGVPLVYISTDYVFDGAAPPYRIDSPPAPINAYGRMKLAGEVAVQRSVRKDSWAIVRIPILYGRVERLDESPVTEIALKVAQRTPFKIDDWASRYPAHADDVAGAIALIAAELLKGKGGVYHFAGAECLTKYRMARIIAETLGIDSSFIGPDPNPPPGAPRPKDCRLDGSSLENLGFKQAIPFADGVREALAPFFKS